MCAVRRRRNSFRKSAKSQSRDGTTGYSDYLCGSLAVTLRLCANACFWILLVSVLTLACNRSAEKKPEIIVAAASDLAPAFEEIGRTFEQAHHVKVTFSFGSSGMLARQIENGAPMDLFAAANSQYIDDLDRKGLIVPGTRSLYARGRITIWTTKDSALKIEKIEDLIRPEVKRIAIANPEHAPYGTVALEALQQAGLWEQIQPRVIYGENIRQTLQFAQTGNVDVALIALSLSLQSDGRWVLVPQELHRPLDQALGVIKGAGQEHVAREFAAFINSPQGLEIMRKYGFSLPEE
jgi:molybdate transport system substrate-binding protein